MKPRSELSASEISELHETLDRRLAGVGIATQPEIASQILELVSKPDSQINEYAKVIRMDPALTGRMLKLTNSAHFAQRTPVTSLDRACALLGIEKLKSFTLGFYLSRAAATDPGEQLSRRVWGQSVFRACLGAELARTIAPKLATEAFVVGLMVDAGSPLMVKLCGAAFLSIAEKSLAPTKQFLSEFRGLAYTHVDVVTVLARRWKLPEVLAHPIAWHHVQPGEAKRSDDLSQLQRIAYYVGAIDLEPTPRTVNEPPPLAQMGQRVLGIAGAELSESVRRASAEYVTVRALFSQISETVDIEGMAGAVHNQLADLLDVSASSVPGAEPRLAFRLGGMRVELRRDQGAEVVACVFDSTGQAILSHRFHATGVDANGLRTAIGLDADPDDQDLEVNSFLGSEAA